MSPDSKISVLINIKQGREKLSHFHLLVKVEDIDSAFFVGYFNVTEVLFKLYVYHFLSDSTSELVGVDVNLDFGLFVAPGEL